MTAHYKSALSKVTQAEKSTRDEIVQVGGRGTAETPCKSVRDALKQHKWGLGQPLKISLMRLDEPHLV